MYIYMYMNIAIIVHPIDMAGKVVCIGTWEGVVMIVGGCGYDCWRV